MAPEASPTPRAGFFPGSASQPDEQPTAPGPASSLRDPIILCRPWVRAEVLSRGGWLRLGITAPAGLRALGRGRSLVGAGQSPARTSFLLLDPATHLPRKVPPSRCACWRRGWGSPTGSGKWARGGNGDLQRDRLPPPALPFLGDAGLRPGGHHLAAAGLQTSGLSVASGAQLYSEL